MDLLRLKNRNIVVFGMANKRSIAFAVGQLLTQAGANIVYIVKDQAVRGHVQPLLGDAPVLTCDVEQQSEVAALPAAIGRFFNCVHGIVHSIAFANYSDGFCAFHETQRRDFLQAMDISCYSLIGIVHHLRPLLSVDAAIVTLSISDTRMAAENYGYMGPVKAALNSTVAFLAKSLSGPENQVRVNAVGAGLLKTSASAGIPGYIDSYLYAEKAILRKRHLETAEVANVVVFLLSPAASGINAQTLVVDAGMSINYFDREIVRKVTGSGTDRT
jgi:enoyl-[acyl-carrier protein] reductase I